MGRLHATSLTGYSNGNLPVEMVKWSPDESMCFLFIQGEGIQVCKGDLSDVYDETRRMVKQRGASNFQVSTVMKGHECYLSVYTAETDEAARVGIYYTGKTARPTIDQYFPAKTKTGKMLWNNEGTVLLVIAGCDVDETGSSYFGVSNLYWMQADGKAKTQKLYTSSDGLVHDLAWSPTKNEFAVIVGAMPPAVKLHDGATGKELNQLGISRRNTLKWNPFGRFVAVAGFGTLPGDMDFSPKL